MVLRDIDISALVQSIGALGACGLIALLFLRKTSWSIKFELRFGKQDGDD